MTDLSYFFSYKTVYEICDNSDPKIILFPKKQRTIKKKIHLKPDYISILLFLYIIKPRLAYIHSLTLTLV